MSSPSAAALFSISLRATVLSSERSRRVESVANELLASLKIADPLRQLDESTASARPRPGKWSKKEIIGHLIDSAANNHQRFIRLQLNQRIEIPGYDGDDWVRVQR